MDRGEDDATGAAAEIAVIFVSARTGNDPGGYAAAAGAMERLAAAQPGYRGIRAVRGADGVGITVSWWADEAAALAWRDQPDHVRIREQGRERWYGWYDVTVARVLRRYAGGWAGGGAGGRAGECAGGQER